MMIDHAWLAPDEDGELYVVRIEMKPPLGNGEVKLFPDGTRTVRPVEDELSEALAWQTVGALAYRIEADRVVRYRPVVDRDLADMRAIRLREVREEAGERIIDFAPMYRQMNAARALLMEDDAAVESAVALFDRIDAVRAACDEAEEDIMAATTAEEAASVTPGWPE